MKYRLLGRSGLKVSEISLGSWLTYGNSVKKSLAMQIIDQAYQLGINFFDTANQYGQGAAERIMGEALRRYPRETYVVATKVFFPMGQGPNDRGLSRKHIWEQAHASLDRLGLDYIDLYYCHRYDLETPLDETLRAMDDLVRQGKVLYLGVSEWTTAQIKEALQIADQYLLDRIIVHQPMYNMLHRAIEATIIPFCQQHGLSQVVYSPLAQGILTGKYKGGVVPKESRATKSNANMYIDSWLKDDLLAKVEQVELIAKNLGITVSQLALAWVLRQENITSALIGASRIEQIEENVKSIEVTLSKEILQQIENIF